jgi:bifunctional DNA-binding transcriptional regulator/antitoxin component of YhaV-PrlF toxin-antitoxin module
MEIITLPNGHVELPHEVCRRMGIDAGTRFEIFIDERRGIITLKPISCEYYSVVHKVGKRKPDLLIKPKRHVAKIK